MLLSGFLTPVIVDSLQDPRPSLIAGLPKPLSTSHAANQLPKKGQGDTGCGGRHLERGLVDLETAFGIRQWCEFG